MSEKQFKIQYEFPSYITTAARMLKKEGFQVYLVGGALRDILLRAEPHDFDLATDATPDEMLKIFPKSISVGRKFGTVIAIIKDDKGEPFEVEITTFRSESDYVDGRWPSKVKFVRDLKTDLSRRDFTINAMALDLGIENKTDEWVVIDPFDGRGDIERKLIKAVGNPIERFKEDGLRAFKACRLSAQLEFEIEKKTFEAIKEALPVARLVSMERIRDEFMKMLMRSSKPSKGIECMRKTGLLKIFLPELEATYGVEQKLFHSTDVYHHSLRALDIAPDSVKLAALFHDIGKPKCDMGNGHFYGHDIEGAKMTEKIMKRLKFPNSEVKRVSNLVKNHMFFFPHYTEDMTPEEKRKYEQHKWSDSAIRRFIARVGEENLDDLFALRIADAASNPKTAFRFEEIEQLQNRISEVMQKDMALTVKELDINGEDIMRELNLKPGPIIGKILKNLLDIVIEDPLKNRKDLLLEEAKKMVNY